MSAKAKKTNRVRNIIIAAAVIAVLAAAYFAVSALNRPEAPAPVQQQGDMMIADFDASKIKEIKYTYNGESIDSIFDKYLAADVNRLVSAVTIEAGMREKGSMKHLRGEIERALLTARRQMHVNIMMIVNGVSNETSSAVARKNSKYVDAVMWATELDERVCEECDALEGEVFLLDEAPACPMHPNCRCRLVPVMREMTPYLVEEIEG